MFFCMLFFFGAGRAEAANIYIDPSSGVDCVGQYNATTFACDSSDTQTMYNSWADVTWASTNDYYQRKGTTFTGQIYSTTGGTSGDRMIFGSYGTGNKPVVTNSASHPLYINNRNYVTVQDMRFEGIGQHSARIMSSFADFHDVTIQNCEFYTSGTANDTYAFSVYISNSWNIHDFIFEGNDVQNVSTGSTPDGLFFYVPGSKTLYDATVSNNNFHDTNGNALRFYDANQADLIANDNRPYGIAVEGNTFQNIDRDAMAFQAGLKSIEGHESYIRNNVANEIGTTSSPQVNAFQTHWFDSVKIYGNSITNVYTSVPDGDGIILDWLSTADGSTCSNNNEVYNNYISGCTGGNTSAGIGVWCGTNNVIHHNVIINSSTGVSLSQPYSTGNVFYNNLSYGNTFGSRIQDPHNIGAPASIWKNNIFSNNSYGVYITNSSTLPTETNNIFYNNSSSNIRNATTVSDIALHPTSVVGNPLFVDPASENFHLQGGSAAVDAGTDVSLNSDYEGNVDYYSSVDAGAYRFQPSQIMGDDEIDIGAGARIYKDGKFRNYGATSGTTADLTITPASGSFTSYGAAETRPSWLDITAITWSNTGNHHKAWTESNSIPGLTNTVHTVGDLEADKYYNVTVDSGITNLTGTNCSTIGTNYVCLANAQGQITFTYTGTYSDHTFDVTEGDNTAPAITRTALGTELDWDTQETHLEITTDENAICRYAREASKTYAQMTDTFDTTGGTTHKTKINNLTHNSSYTYYVRCIDVTTNANSSSAEISFSVKSLPELKIDHIKTETSQTQIEIEYDTTRKTDTLIQYGTDKDSLPWEAKKEGTTKDHSLTISGLKPDTRYYFQIQAEDSYEEEASETLSVATQKETLTSYLFPQSSKLKEDNNPEDKKEAPLEKVAQKVQETKQNLDNFFTSKIQKTNDQIILAEAKFKIVDKNDQPIPNLPVTLHSDPKDSITDENGIATFKDVPTGNHTLTFAYNNDNFEKRVAISDPKTNTDTVKAEIVTVKATHDGMPVWVWGVMGGLVLIILTLFAVNRRGRKMV